MKVYIDVIVIINFIYDALIIASTSILLKRNISIKRIILGALIGEVSICLLFIKLDSLILFIFKVLLSLLMVFISFGKNDLLNNLFYFYIITIVIGGGEYLICDNNYKVNILFLIVLGPIISYLYIKSIKDYKYKLSIMHDVILIDGDNIINLKGYLDTGNTLVDPIFKYPVIMINDKIKFLNNKYFYVPYKVINDKSILKCIKIDKVIVDGHVIECLLGLCNESIFKGSYDVILNNNIKEIMI